MKDLDELVTLWADDPGSLSTEERARVEAHLAQAPGAADETRALLERLRGLRETPAPDALPRDILRAIDAEEARATRSPWRWLRPAFGLALAGAAAAVVIVARQDRGPDAPTARVTDAGVPVTPTRIDRPAPSRHDAPLALGAEGALADEELDEAVVDEVVLALGGDEWDADAPEPEDGLVPDLTLDWVDELDDEQVDAVDRWLAAR